MSASNARRETEHYGPCFNRDGTDTEGSSQPPCCSMATLDATARSESAKRLIARLANELTNWETAFADRKNQRKGRLEKLQAAIGAFMADLLNACNHPEANGWTWRSLTKSGFTGQTVSFRDFDAIVKAWLACGSRGARSGLQGASGVRSWRPTAGARQGFEVSCDRKAVSDMRGARDHSSECG